MGEVYRARDPRLQRDVAIKILPSSFALDADRLQRFEREARMLAALDHQHIAAIYGVEELSTGAGAGPGVCRRADAGGRSRADHSTFTMR